MVATCFSGKSSFPLCSLKKTQVSQGLGWEGEGYAAGTRESGNFQVVMVSHSNSQLTWKLPELFGMGDNRERIKYPAFWQANGLFIFPITLGP